MARTLLCLYAAITLPFVVQATTGHTEPRDLTGHWVGVVALVIFVLAYALVMSEEFTNLRKPRPVMLAASIAVHFWVNAHF